jgi:addiction module RelE/StbE family toxin
MYELYMANTKTEKMLTEYLSLRLDIEDKLERLKQEPRRANGAHPLRGKLKGNWACWLGSNIRLIYNINDEKKIIIAKIIGSHKIY